MDAPPHLLILFLWIIGAPLLGMLFEYASVRREIRNRPRVTPEDRAPGSATRDRDAQRAGTRV